MKIKPAGQSTVFHPGGERPLVALLRRFWGAAFALGSRRPDRDPLIAAVLSVVTYVLFDRLLGVPLPGGPLMGVL